MKDYTKSVKRLLREYMTEAYERELHRELARLDESFAEWRSGKISSGELSYRVHHYDTGPSRELFRRYNDADHDMSVAYAIVTGILDEATIPPELLAAIGGPLSFYRSLKEREELRMPGEG